MWAHQKEWSVIEVFVESIRVNMTNYRRVVMLKEKTSPRYLPIWIGHFEADAIAIPMQNVPVQRPLTHDLLKGAIEQLGGKLTQVVINELADETFFAKLIVDAGGRHVEVDARPSDAIALAIRAKVPIYVDESVFEQAGLVFENEETEGEVEAEEATEIDLDAKAASRRFGHLPGGPDDPALGRVVHRRRAEIHRQPSLGHDAQLRAVALRFRKQSRRHAL